MILYRCTGSECEDRNDRGKNSASAHQCGVYWIPVGIGQSSAVGREIHVVLDNLSAHKTPAVEPFLALDMCENA